MASFKTEVVRDLFQKRYDSEAKTLSWPVVTLNDVSNAILAFNQRTGQSQSTRNPANFFKDFIRNRQAANRNWPQEVFESGYTARQVTGGNLCFEFVPLRGGQIEPFESVGAVALSDDLPVHEIESVSLPLASRRLGRSDEAWLIQVVTRLRIIETHFSLFSGRAVKQVGLLQLNVKLSRTEIDAIFLAQEEASEGTYREVILTCEVKVGRDDLLADQILRQAQAPFRMPSITQDVVIPLAVKCAAPSTLIVVEFEALERDSFEEADSLVKASESVYRIRPPVPGVCE